MFLQEYLSAKHSPNFSFCFLRLQIIGAFDLGNHSFSTSVRNICEVTALLHDINLFFFVLCIDRVKHFLLNVGNPFFAIFYFYQVYTWLNKVRVYRCQRFLVNSSKQPPFIFMNIFYLVIFFKLISRQIMFPCRFIGLLN